MQEAFKNPHYKKIWEKVIINRHPKTKTLEETLEMESKERYCQYMLTDNDNFIVDGDYISKYYHHNNNYKILGTPITLEDIISILPTNSTHFIKRENNLLVIKFFGKNEVEDDFIKYSIYWQLTKPLHEQTPETWEKIANLI